MYRRFGSIVLDTAFRFLVPFLVIYAIYVLVHGEDSPGGGFQAGVVLAIVVILVRIIQGHEADWNLDRRTAIVLASVGTLIYAGIGLVTLFWGGNVLDYGVLPLGEHAAEIRALGILGIEIGVTLAVMGVFIIIFDLLTEGVD